MVHKSPESYLAELGDAQNISSAITERLDRLVSAKHGSEWAEEVYRREMSSLIELSNQFDGAVIEVKAPYAEKLKVWRWEGSEYSEHHAPFRHIEGSETFRGERLAWDEDSESIFLYADGGRSWVRLQFADGERNFSVVGIDQTD